MPGAFRRRAGLKFKAILLAGIVTAFAPSAFAPSALAQSNSPLPLDPPPYRAEINQADQTFSQAQTAYHAGQFDNALLYAKIAGANGNADAQVLAGHIQLTGKTGHIDTYDAARWFLNAAQLGNVEAMVSLGKMGLKSKGGLNTSDAMTWLKRAAEQGDAGAMELLADMHTLGKGTAPNAQAAQRWQLKSANLGGQKSMRQMGDDLFETNPKSALIWYEKAARTGDAQAAYIAAIMYAENFEITPNSIKAAELLAQAANAGIASAQADYGLMVYQGNGVAKSASDAAKWFEKSANGGDVEGRFLYAFTLAKGDGVPKSFEDAYYWLLMADKDAVKTVGQSGDIDPYNSGASADDYDQSRAELRKRLEANVEPAILARARARVR